MLDILEDGLSIEIAMVGNEGLLGIALFMGGETAPSSAVVQSAGYGYRLPSRLCRWLLLSLDRLSSDSLTVTQEMIANMLGVRRESVTEAAGRL